MLSNESGTTNHHGQLILEALTGFIQPIVQCHENGLHSTDADIMFSSSSETAGQELLRALRKFIAEIVGPQLPDCQTDDMFNTEITITIEEPVKELEPDYTPTHAPVSVPARILQSQELPTSVQEDARRHVFNKMPLRVLAFDANGSNLQLIDRSEILRRILSGLLERNTDSVGYLKSMLIEHLARYAILSHTWIRDAPGELVYGDWNNRDSNQRGYQKIVKFCQVAAGDHGVTLGWMDTICINKESSSELDESIRSMYKWYRGAHVCIAYLAETLDQESMHLDPWFTRGWTLQELLAPNDIRFYKTSWESITPGIDSDYVIMEPQISYEIQAQIEKATTITEYEMRLCRWGEADMIPFSRKMQLAANRTVTREEDEVYSLMGLLGVEISIAYGEGSRRALYRLMREVLNSKTDVLDIFNHGYDTSPTLMPSNIKDYIERSPIFDQPANKDIATWNAFEIARDEQKLKASLLDKWQPLEPIISTHLGIRVPLLLLPALKLGAYGPRYNPLGEISGIVELREINLYSARYQHDYWPTMIYQLLDKNIYKDDLTDIVSALPATSIPYVLVFGILNFGVDNATNIVLPENCFSVLLDCGTKVVNVGPSDAIKIVPWRSPVTLQLQSTRSANKIPRGELANHGMQLVSLYLQ